MAMLVRRSDAVATCLVMFALWCTYLPSPARDVAEDITATSTNALALVSIASMGGQQPLDLKAASRKMDGPARAMGHMSGECAGALAACLAHCLLVLLLYACSRCHSFHTASVRVGMPGQLVECPVEDQKHKGTAETEKRIGLDGTPEVVVESRRSYSAVLPLLDVPTRFHVTSTLMFAIDRCLAGRMLPTECLGNNQQRSVVGCTLLPWRKRIVPKAQFRELIVMAANILSPEI